MNHWLKDGTKGALPLRAMSSLICAASDSSLAAALTMRVRSSHLFTMTF